MLDLYAKRKDNNCRGILGFQNLNVLLFSVFLFYLGGQQQQWTEPSSGLLVFLRVILILWHFFS